MSQSTITQDACACQRSVKAGPWVVSTPHRNLTAAGFGLSWTPYGTRHARRIGSLTTACGRPALSWKNFHDLAFVPGAADTCQACTERVSRLRH